MPMKPGEMVKLLERNGFIKKSQNGSSHLKLFKVSSKTTVIVPIHAKEFGKGLESAILKQAGIKVP